MDEDAVEHLCFIIKRQYAWNFTTVSGADYYVLCQPQNSPDQAFPITADGLHEVLLQVSPKADQGG